MHLRARTVALTVTVAAAVAVPSWLLGGPFDPSGFVSPHQFSNASVADADQVNANFAHVADALNDLNAREAPATTRARTLAAPPTSPPPQEGDLYYDTVAKRVFVHDGAAWRRLLFFGEGGAGTSPLFADTFSGTSLGSHWVSGLGSVTASITEDRYRVTDASETDTYGWFYDLDCTNGNQVRWAQAIGSGDFDLSAQLGWNTTVGGDVFGGYWGLIMADGKPSVIAGWQDGSASLGGGAVIVRQRNGSCPGGTSSDDGRVWSNSAPDVGQGVFRLRRTGGLLVVSWNGVEVLSATNTDAITSLAMVTNRHHNGSTHYTFGTIDFLDVQGSY